MTQAIPQLATPFYMILVEGRGWPTKIHTAIEDARTEANRLAGIEPGRRVFVLASTEYARCEQSPIAWVKVGGLS